MGCRLAIEPGTVAIDVGPVTAGRCSPAGQVGGNSRCRSLHIHRHLIGHAKLLFYLRPLGSAGPSPVVVVVVVIVVVVVVIVEEVTPSLTPTLPTLSPSIAYGCQADSLVCVTDGVM